MRICVECRSSEIGFVDWWVEKERLGLALYIGAGATDLIFENSHDISDVLQVEYLLISCSSGRRISWHVWRHGELVLAKLLV